MTTTITQSTCTRYDLRHKRASSSWTEWAIILLDERSGLLSIHSEYGSWAHCWPDHGRNSLRHLLVDIGDNADYLLGKLCRGGKVHFNVDATANRVKEIIETAVREEGCLGYHSNDSELVTREVADEMLDELANIVDEWGYSEGAFGCKLLDSNVLWWTCDYVTDGLLVREYDPQCREFLERLWPLFVDHLRQEIGAGVSKAVSP